MDQSDSFFAYKMLAWKDIDSGVIMVKKLSLILGIIALFSCKGEPEPEVYWSYGGPTTTEYHNEEYDLCWFTGPAETVVLGRLTGPPVFVGLDPDCTVPDPYVQAYWRLDLETIRSTGPDEGEITVVAFTSWNEDQILDAGVKAGDELLVSIREAQGVYFALRTFPVQLAAAQSTSNPNGIPSDWSTLEREVADTQARYASVCKGGPVINPPDGTVPGTRTMTAQEFDALVHMPAEKTCNPPDSQDVGGEPGTVETDPH